MHHLGHIFLAEETGGFQFGAFIADGIRGAKFQMLPLEVQRGIQFHRWVDWQTDRHPAFLQARQLMRPVASRYAGLIVDLWLDVVLGQLWEKFSSEPLEAFEERFRAETLRPYRGWSPVSWDAFIQDLERKRLLLLFATPEGMLEHIRRFIYRRNLPLDSQAVCRAIEGESEKLGEILSRFWQDAFDWRRRAATFIPNP
ncbi:MAG: ACP phosphodiesterase [Bacteroidia bacterium]|nr:ACP phosphodiesterase [Bacteroidia bacterium]MCX7763538.1 ACP phosphodiesterase [Bacteroidia bacterium]MDW8057363.1 ACP phosphodiesterase [Bacteroidia bacterium]